MRQLRTYQIVYESDWEHVHAEVTLHPNRNPQRVVDRMMRDGEAHGLPLTYRRKPS